MSSGSTLSRPKPRFSKDSGMLASGLVELQPQGQTRLLLSLDKTTCFYALVLTSLKISSLSCLLTMIENRMTPLIVMLLKTSNSITVSLSWQLGAIGSQTSLGQARTYLGNTDVLILHIQWESWCPSCALPLPLPIVCLSSLTMQCGHFIPAASLPANSALLWQSLCILLSSLCLAHLRFWGVCYSSAKEWYRLGTCQLLLSRSNSSKDLLRMIQV